MKKTRTYLIYLAMALSTIVMIFKALRWSGESGVELAQQEFLEHFTQRDWKECHAMVAENYTDKWQFKHNELSLLMQDFSRQFIIPPRAAWRTISISKNNKAYEINGILSFEGGTGPSSGIILREVRTYTGLPFRFQWKQGNILPWSWQLEGIDHPTLELPSGYTPGRHRMLTVPF
ncbi:MAG: hypothetical protein MK183_13380 [Verrucomicrobiales bacterium]|nr:hypothetical protein [Verrucomicrobiales bacterium]